MLLMYTKSIYIRGYLFNVITLNISENTNVLKICLVLNHFKSFKTSCWEKNFIFYYFCRNYFLSFNSFEVLKDNIHFEFPIPK